MGRCVEGFWCCPRPAWGKALSCTGIPLPAPASLSWQPCRIWENILKCFTMHWATCCNWAISLRWVNITCKPSWASGFLRAIEDLSEKLVIMLWSTHLKHGPACSRPLRYQQSGHNPPFLPLSCPPCNGTLQLLQPKCRVYFHCPWSWVGFAPWVGKHNRQKWTAYASSVPCKLLLLCQERWPGTMWTSSRLGCCKLRAHRTDIRLCIWDQFS